MGVGEIGIEGGFESGGVEDHGAGLGGGEGDGLAGAAGFGLIQPFVVDAGEDQYRISAPGQRGAGGDCANRAVGVDGYGTAEGGGGGGNHRRRGGGGEGQEEGWDYRHRLFSQGFGNRE